MLLNGQTVPSLAAAKITEESSLAMTAMADAEILLADVLLA